MPIVSTGQLTVTDVSDTPVISLTNNSHQVATDAYGLNGNYFGCNTTIRIYLGNQEVSASWAITATPSSGVTGALDGRTYSVTDMTGDVGYVDFTASKFGWESISARFSIVKSKRGDAGQALLILPSTLGFTFVDGFPSPQTQAIAFSVLKNGVSGDVEWQVSEGASLITDTSEQGSMTGFMFGTSGTVVGEVAYMDVADMNNKNEVVVSATCDGVTASHVVMRLDAYTAEAGATRNEISQGVLASRPAGTAGEFYYATDTFELYQKISDSWVLSSNKTSVDSSGNIQGVSSGSGLSVANNTDSVIRAPGGGVYVTNTPTMTGRLKITLPQSWTNTMMRFTVEIYEFSTGYMCTLEIGGYNYAPVTSWHNVTARVIGGSNVEYPVYFGHDGTKCCIWIGAATNETWSYPQVRIRDFFAGYSNYARTQWESGWAISFDQTAIASGTGANQYSASVTDTLPGANWAKISGTNKPADGATRNVFQGDWVSGTSYSVGDVVVKDGYSWTCKVATSSAAPPIYPTTSNSNWGMSGEKGDSALAVVMPNDAHTLPASSAGVVSSYTGSGTTIEVMDGSTKLSASSTATTSAFRITGTTVSPASSITVGAITYSGTAATVAAHSAMGNSNDTVQIAYNITAYRANGTAVNLTKVQTLTKSKAGSNGSKGDTGAQGPSVIVTASRAASFTSTDGTLDASQSDIVFTATVSGVTSPTYSWTFSGLQTNPTTASTTSTQTITAAQFGNSKSATVTCTVSSTYKDVVTIVRLEKSTAAAGATVGATAGSNLYDANGSIISTDAIKNNLIDLGFWKKDAVSPWGLNGAHNRLCNAVGDVGIAAGPKGVDDVVWYCWENETNGENGGGWNASFLSLDPNKAYRFVVPLRVLDGNGIFYWGTDNVCTLNTTTAISNPYFVLSHKSNLSTDRWYLLVGYIFPYGSTNNSHESSGIWDCKTGQKISTGTNYNHLTGYVNHRAYQFYATQGAVQVFGRPMINLIDGTEPSLREYFETSAVLNSALVPSIESKLSNNSRNVLSGAGGIAVGSLTWDTSGNRTGGNGIGITAKGIAAHNGTKFGLVIDVDGNATFGGELNAATGSFAGSLSAATGTFSGTLTASAVNAVNTINIAGNAVTVPVSAYSESTGKISVGTGWYDLQSAYIDTEGQPVIVIATATNGTFGMPLIWGVFDKDGVAIAQSVGDSCAITASSSKSGTFKLKARMPGGSSYNGAIMYRSLVLLGAKR